jgi:hypothetical protein
VKVLEHGLSDSARARATAQALAALCVGGMVVARPIADQGLADELRDACVGGRAHDGRMGQAGKIAIADFQAAPSALEAGAERTAPRSSRLPV